MPKSHDFGRVLTRIREEQGYKTAHSFYRDCGGRKALGLAFVNYRSFERGLSLPQPPRVQRLLAALGLGDQSLRSQELVRSYLVCLLGSEELLRYVSRPQAAPLDLPSQRLAEEAARQALSQRTARLSQAQYMLLCSNERAFLCHMVLVNTPEWLEFERLASLTRLSPAAVTKALGVLYKAKLADISGSRIRSRLCGKYVAMPAAIPAPTAMFNTVKRYDWLKKRSRLTHLSGLTVRFSKPQLERYLEHLSEMIRVSAVFGDIKNTRDTAVYFIEGGVYELFSNRGVK